MTSGFDVPKAMTTLEALLHCIAQTGAFVETEGANARQVKFVITSDRNILGVPGDDTKIYLGTCNLEKGVRKDDDENTVYLAHAFFRQPKKEQIKILYFLMVSKLIRELDTARAMEDAERFVENYYR